MIFDDELKFIVAHYTFYKHLQLGSNIHKVVCEVEFKYFHT